MSARFRLPAGRSYNVRATELERDRQHTQVVCNVLLLDNTVQAFKVSVSTTPSSLVMNCLSTLYCTPRLRMSRTSCDTISSSLCSVVVRFHMRIFLKRDVFGCVAGLPRGQRGFQRGGTHYGGYKSDKPAVMMCCFQVKYVTKVSRGYHYFCCRSQLSSLRSFF